MGEKSNRGGEDIAKAMGILHRFNQFDPKMQVSTILTFLEIAAAEERGKPLGTEDIQKRIGLKTGTSSRNVYYWAEGHRSMTGGHKMVSVEIDPNDRRKRILELTSKGKAFLAQLNESGMHSFR